MFMTVLDVSIVNVALPTIGEKLHFSEGSLQWVVTAYALTFGGFLLLGRLLDDEGETVAAPARGVALEPLDVAVVAVEDLCAGDGVQIGRPPKSVTAISTS